MNVFANGLTVDATNGDKRSPASTTASDSSEVFRFAMAVRENARLRELDDGDRVSDRDRRPPYCDLLSPVGAPLHVHVNNNSNNNNNNNNSNYSSSSSGIASHQTGLSNDNYYSSSSQPWYEQAELWPNQLPSPNQQASQDDLRPRSRPLNAAWEGSSSDLNQTRYQGQGNGQNNKPLMTNGIRYYPEVNPAHPDPATARRQQQITPAHRVPTSTQEHDIYWHAYLQKQQQHQQPADDDYAALVRNECARRIQPKNPSLMPANSAVNASVNSFNNGVVDVANHRGNQHYTARRVGAMHHTSSDAEDSASDTYIEHRVMPNGTSPVGVLSVKNVSQLNTPINHPHPASLLRMNGSTQKNSILTSSRSSVASVLETDLDTGEERDVVILAEANGSLSFLPVEVEGRQGRVVNGDSFNLADSRNSSLRQSAASLVSNCDSQSPNTSLTFGLNTSTPRSRSNSNTNSLRKNRNLADKVRKSTRIRIKPLDDIADALQEVTKTNVCIFTTKTLSSNA